MKHDDTICVTIKQDKTAMFSILGWDFPGFSAISWSSRVNPFFYGRCP